MRVARIAAVLTLALIALARVSHVVVAQGEAQGTTLQYRWKQGDVLVYRTSVETATTVSGMPGGDDVSFDQTMTQRIRLLAAAVAPGGSVTLHQTTEAVSVEMESPAGKVSYDSADPQSAEKDERAEALGRVFGGIVGSTISITMAPDGSIQRIDGIQKVLDKITQGLPQDRVSASLVQGLRSVLSEPAVRASLEQSFPRMPAQPVKPGDTWNAPLSVSGGATGRVTGTQTMTLETIDGSMAAVAVAVALKQESAPPLGPSGMIVTMGDSKGEGQITFDVALGRIRKSTMKTEIPSTMTTQAPDGRQATIRNATKTSMTMELVEK